MLHIIWLLTLSYLVDQGLGGRYFAGRVQYGDHYGREFVVSFFLTETPITAVTERLKLTFVNSQDEATIVTTRGVDWDQKVFLHKNHNLRANQSLTLNVSDQFQDLRSTLNGGLAGVLHVTSDEDIALFVTNAAYGAETYLAIPVEQWGTSYKIVTLPSNPIVHVISNQIGTFIHVRLLDQFDSHREISRYEVLSGVDEDGSHTHVDVMQVTHTFMKGIQAFQVHRCFETDSHSDRQDFTNLEVQSTRPVGVIAGNCRSSLGSQNTGNYIAEMMPPGHSWGKKFFFGPFDRRPGERGGSPWFAMRILKISPTEATIYYGKYKSRAFKHKWGYPTIFHEMRMSFGSLISIETDMPIMVTLLSPPLPSGGLGAMLVVVPMENWISKYMVTYPAGYIADKCSTPYNFQLIIYCWRHMKDDMIINGRNIREAALHYHAEFTIDTHRNNLVRINLLIDSRPRQHTFVVQHQGARRFGLQIAAAQCEIGTEFYSGGSGFRSKSDFCVPNPFTMRGEDKIDNDCDGLVDEEIYDGISNDFDSLIDEDLGIVDGQWGPYDENKKTCSVPCGGQGSLGYLRKCDSPPPSPHGKGCTGAAVKPGSGSEPCDTSSVVCPEDCELHKWGIGCSNECGADCVDQTCDPETGFCFNCTHPLIRSNFPSCSTLNISFIKEKPKEHPLFPVAIVLTAALAVLVVILSVCMLWTRQTEKRQKKHQKSDKDKGQLIPEQTDATNNARKRSPPGTSSAVREDQ